MEEQLDDLVGAAKFLHLSRSRVYEKSLNGELPALQLNGRGKILFRRSDLMATLKPKTRKPKTQVNA